jgi:hypothetical protein
MGLRNYADIMGGNCEKLGENFCENDRKLIFFKFLRKNAKHVSNM